VPSKYQIISEMAAHEAANITSSTKNYIAFLRTAANNYKYDFRDQLLIHAQNPSATACAEIEVWNKLGRWVNKGTKGIALLVDGDSRYKLRYVFDVADTNSYYGRTVNLWQMQPRYENEVTESLKNRFGEIGESGVFEGTLFELAGLVAEDNYTDYLSQLTAVKKDSLLEELDDLNTSAWFRGMLKSSVAYMLFTRCGCDTHRFFEAEDFARIGDFNTPETISILGTASSDISEMVLREIGDSLRGLVLAEKKQIRTFAKETTVRHNDAVRQTTISERSFEHGTDIQSGGRLSSAEPDRTGEPDAGQVRDAAPELPSGAAQGPLHGDDAVREAERAPGADRPAGIGADGSPDRADGAGAGRERDAESDGSNALGAADEQHPERGGGNGADGADLPVSEALPTVDQQIQDIEEAETDKVSAFSISQEDVDAVLLRGSGVSEGKFRIYEQFLKNETAEENAKMLKDEYGLGGSYPAAMRDGQKLDEGHDGKGIKIGVGSISNPDASILLPWKKVEKRIGELIAADRYLNSAERTAYPAYRKGAEDRAARNEIASEFRSLIYDYNDYWTQLNRRQDGVLQWPEPVRRIS